MEVRTAQGLQSCATDHNADLHFDGFRAEIVQLHLGEQRRIHDDIVVVPLGDDLLPSTGFYEFFQSVVWLLYTAC